MTEPLSNERLAQLITEVAVTATMLNQHDLLAALCELVERRERGERLSSEFIDGDASVLSQQFKRGQ